MGAEQSGASGETPQKPTASGTDDDTSGAEVIERLKSHIAELRLQQQAFERRLQSTSHRHLVGRDACIQENERLKGAISQARQQLREAEFSLRPVHVAYTSHPHKPEPFSLWGHHHSVHLHPDHHKHHQNVGLPSHAQHLGRQALARAREEAHAQQDVSTYSQDLYAEAAAGFHDSFKSVHDALSSLERHHHKNVFVEDHEMAAHEHAKQHQTHTFATQTRRGHMVSAAQKETDDKAEMMRVKHTDRYMFPQHKQEQEL